MNRFFVYLLAALIPPLGFGLAVALSTMSTAMIHEEPRPLPSSSANSPVIEPSVSAKPKPFRAVILLSTSGTETLEALGPYEILAASGVFEVRTAAATTDWLRTTSDLAIRPDVRLNDVTEGDLLVIPSVIDSGDAALLAYLGQNATNFKHLLISGEAARLVTRTPLLAERRATTHFLAAEDLADVKPAVHWFAGPRAIRDEEIISTAGLSATLDGTLDALGEIAGPRVAEKTAATLGWTWHHDDVTRFDGKSWLKLSPFDNLRSLYNAGYDWDHPTISVLAYPGVGELGLAAALDVLPRAYTLKAQSVSAGRDGEREPVTTRHGLRILSAHDLTTPLPSDLLLIPSRSHSGTASAAAGETPPLEAPALHRWITQSGVPVKNFYYDAPGAALSEALDLLAQLKGFGASRLVAKIMLLPPPEPQPTVSGPTAATFLWVALHPLLLSILCLFIVWRVDVRISKRRVLIQPKLE